MKAPNRSLALVVALLVMSAGGSAHAASPTTRVAEHPVPLPRFQPPLTQTDQMAATKPRGKGGDLRAAGLVAPFLTRPYLGMHYLTSVFDHCTPDYSADGKICRFDGTVALRSNGVDPAFPSGYAVTPGGHDYLYYDGHNGWDMALTYEPVIAAADGVVVLAGADPFNPGFGQTVTLDHGNGFTTRYSHLSQISVLPNQWVPRGRRLGISGNSGYSSGPHLHFGVYANTGWTPVDPWGWTGATADPWPYDLGNLWLTGNPQDPVPWSPTEVSVAAGDGSATVSWTEPGFDGGSSLAGYVVTAAPGGGTVGVGAGTTRASVAGLKNGTAYTFTVTASNGVGAGPASASSNSAIPWAGRQYQPLVPARILDTRDGTGGFGTLGPNQSIDVPVTGRGGVPGSGATAVVLNVTATNPTQAGYLTVYPSGVPRPLASTLNFGPSQTVPNLVEVPVGAGGRVSVYNYLGRTDVLWDVAGWVSSPGTFPGSAGLYEPLVPARLLDTRESGGPLQGGQTVTHPVTGRAGVPTTGVGAVLLNVTVTQPTGASYLSVYPGELARPLASNLNFGPAQTVANRVLVKLGAGGEVGLYIHSGSAHVVVDVSGWFTDGSAPVARGGRYNGLTPTRLVDTRDGTGGVLGPLGPEQIRSVAAAGQGGVPALGAAGAPIAVVLNVTVTQPTAPGYLTAYPGGVARPLASDVNFAPGQTVANLVVVKLGADGGLAVYNNTGTTHLVIDVLGWFDST